MVAFLVLRKKSVALDLHGPLGMLMLTPFLGIAAPRQHLLTLEWSPC